MPPSYLLLLRSRDRLIHALIGFRIVVSSRGYTDNREASGQRRSTVGSISLDVADSSRRQVLIDFYRSCSMLFVFYHHTTTVFPGAVDLFPKFNPFAELFISISGFMVGMVYLHKESYRPLVLRGLKVLAAYFVVSVPVAMGMAVLGKVQEPVGEAIFNVLTFQSEPTAITILKFYGLMFLLLPLILPAFKRHKLLVLVSSAVVFLLSTRVAGAMAVTYEKPAPTFFLFLLQGQLFLIFGIWLGDLHRSKRLIGRPFYVTMALIFLAGLSLDFYLGFPSNGDKYPYKFDKLINLLWTLPLLLLVLRAVFDWIKEWPATALVLNVGRNSLIAFLASEVVRQFVKLALLIAGVHPQIYCQTLTGIFDVVFVTVLLWYYRSYWQDRFSMPYLQGSRS
jgi:OpgC protein